LQPKVKATKERTVNQEIVPAIPQKSARIRENYNELRLEMEGNTLDLDFSFLRAGNFQMDSYEDGPNADRRVNDYKKRTVAVNKNTRLKIMMAPGGGWAAHLTLR